jgi:hypothetical protein
LSSAKDWSNEASGARKMIAFTVMVFIRPNLYRCGWQTLTIVEEALPSGSLRARTSHIINVPVLATLRAKLKAYFMFLDTDGAEPGPKNVLIRGEVSFVCNPFYVV